MSEQPTLPAAPRGMLALLTAAAFVIFAQIFMVAPILPRLAEVFGAEPGLIGLAVPAYLVPYGAMVLVWGPASEHLGRRPVILASLAAFTVLVGVTALAGSAGTFIGMRLATAIGASGVVPISLALIGDLYPYQRRGYALGWLFGGMAGGMAVGATAGALGEPLVGWSGLFLAAGAAGLVLLIAALGLLPQTRLEAPKHPTLTRPAKACPAPRSGPLPPRVARGDARDMRCTGAGWWSIQVVLLVRPVPPGRASQEGTRCDSGTAPQR